MEIEPIRDILRRTYYLKTINLTISLPFDMLREIESFIQQNQINSRSLAIAYLIHQGLVRIKEKNWETEVEEPEEG